MGDANTGPLWWSQLVDRKSEVPWRYDASQFQLDHRRVDKGFSLDCMQVGIFSFFNSPDLIGSLTVEATHEAKLILCCLATLCASI